MAFCTLPQIFDLLLLEKGFDSGRILTVMDSYNIINTKYILEQILDDKLSVFVRFSTTPMKWYLRNASLKYVDIVVALRYIDDRFEKWLYVPIVILSTAMSRVCQNVAVV